MHFSVLEFKMLGLNIQLSDDVISCNTGNGSNVQEGQMTYKDSVALG